MTVLVYLVGRHIRLEWADIKAVGDGDLLSVLEENADVFRKGLGRLKDYETSIHVDPQAQPLRLVWFYT